MTSNQELINHPEWEKDNSLSTPSDRVDNKSRPDTGTLTTDEGDIAVSVLSETSFIKKFPRLDKTYADPPIQGQNIGLISFTPSKGAVPDEKGIYGFAKLRGNFNNEKEADERSEFIIRNCDSYHTIYQAYVGRPFPITFKSDFSAETSEIDIRNSTTKAISQNIKTKKKEEQTIMKEIQEREEELRRDVEIDKEEDLEEIYTTCRVKKAQLTWNYLEHQKKLKEIRDIVIKTRDQIEKLEIEHPEYKDTYYAKYINARKKAGLKLKPDESENNFMKFLVEDVELDF